MSLAFGSLEEAIGSALALLVVLRLLEGPVVAATAVASRATVDA